MQAKNARWPLAIHTGLSSVGYFKKVIKADPNFLPAYYGIGAFNYYVSQNLKWMPFIGDKSEEGLSQIRRSGQSGFPYSLAAKNSLCWIFCERKQYASADSIADIVLKAFPDNTVFLRIKARVAYLQKDWIDATTYSRRLIELSEKRQPVNYSDLLSGYQILISAYDGLNRKTECFSCCKKILARFIPEPYSSLPYVKRHEKTIAEMYRKYRGE
jgi:tetratricopeptide (TPR) repeat protein